MNISIKTIVIICCIIVGLFIGGYIYHTIKVNNLERDLVQAQIDANKYEFAYKISDSLWKSFGGIQKFDSIYNTLGDIKDEIKKNNEKPIIITQLKPQVIINNISADTTKPDPLDSTYRTASANHPKGYYELSARYQVVNPWNFEFSKVYIPDKFDIVTAKTKDNRVVVYVKNWNPFVKVDSVQTFIDPIMITNFKEVEKKTWKWITSLNTNFQSSSYKWFDVWNLTSGIYMPSGFGLNLGTNYYRNVDKVHFNFGIGFIKTF